LNFWEALWFQVSRVNYDFIFHLILGFCRSSVQDGGVDTSSTLLGGWKITKGRFLTLKQLRRHAEQVIALQQLSNWKKWGVSNSSTNIEKVKY